MKASVKQFLWVRVGLCCVLSAMVMSAKAELTVLDEGAAATKQMALKDILVPIKPLPVWTLTGGQSVGHELKAWGEKAGWQVVWNLSTDWSVPASTQFSGEFPAVAAEVIKTLAANGALIHAQFFEGNKTLVVTGPGVSE